jgi:hypothetical protein
VNATTGVYTYNVPSLRTITNGCITSQIYSQTGWWYKMRSMLVQTFNSISKRERMRLFRWEQRECLRTTNDLICNPFTNILPIPTSPKLIGTDLFILSRFPLQYQIGVSSKTREKGSQMKSWWTTKTRKSLNDMNVIKIIFVSKLHACAQEIFHRACICSSLRSYLNNNQKLLE